MQRFAAVMLEKSLGSGGQLLFSVYNSLVITYNALKTYINWYN